jgi:hypothetical protein
VIRIVDMPRLRVIDDQVHHGFLRGDVESGGRLVRDQKLRIAGQRQRDHHALAHAARQFERIGVVALARAGDLDLLQRLDRLLAAVARGGLHVLAQHVLDLIADFADRVQRRARILEDHRDLAAAQVGSGLRSRPDVDAGNTTEPSAICWRGRASHYRMRQWTAGAGSLTMPSVSPWPVMLTLHRLDDAAPRGVRR